MKTSEFELNEFLWRQLEGLQANPLPAILVATAAIAFWLARVRLVERARRRVTAAADAYATRELSME